MGSAIAPPVLITNHKALMGYLSLPKICKACKHDGGLGLGLPVLFAGHLIQSKGGQVFPVSLLVCVCAGVEKGGGVAYSVYQ